MSDINPKAVEQVIKVGSDALKFCVPCAICISGPSQVGKSEFIVKLVEKRSLLFTQEFVRILYCQPEILCTRQNSVFDRIQASFPRAELISGLPDVAKLNLDLDKRPKLLIIDDLMSEFLSSKHMLKLLSIQVHHFSISTIVTLHNYYATSKFGKTLSRNMNYKVFFYNRLDVRELKNISDQIGAHPNFLSKSFEFLLKTFPKEPTYIVIDGHIKSEMIQMHVRSKILPDPETNEIKPIIFFPDI